ncbi:GH10287 [Drosophila grimshawi]|uniref:GH10287 n=1 Tax=Drosophila grimshawi TaxID=7222 RepID=B4K1J9_DROGR|nr:GH10287 [Drosophila grimshawi]
MRGDNCSTDATAHTGSYDGRSQQLSVKVGTFGSSLCASAVAVVVAVRQTVSQSRWQQRVRQF